MMGSGVGESDAALIWDVLTLPERKEAEVLAGLLLHREHQVQAAQSRFAGLRRHIKDVCRDNSTCASLSAAPSGLGVQGRCEGREGRRRERPEVAAWLWPSESVRGVDVDCGSPGRRQGSPGHGNAPDLDLGTQTHAACNAIAELREKDRLLSLGLDWLTAELEEAKSQAQQLIRPESQEASGLSRYFSSPGENVCEELCTHFVQAPDVPEQRDNELAHMAASLHQKSPADVDEIIHQEVARFLDKPQGRRCRVLLCRLGPRAYLYGSRRLGLRLCALTGQLEARAEDHNGGTWSAFGPFLAGLDGTQHDLTQQARAIAHVAQAEAHRTERGQRSRRRG